MTLKAFAPLLAVLAVAGCLAVGQPRGDGEGGPDAFAACRAAIEDRLTGATDFDGGSQDRDVLEGIETLTGEVAAGGVQHTYQCRVRAGRVFNLVLTPGP